MNDLIFLNHASFAIENEKEVLLIDPWYEGTAFHNGWALLDDEITNLNILSWLEKTQKSIYIWYSHEHSDHFSISFLKEVQNSKLKVKVIFQKTLDGRVSNFLRKQGFSVFDAEEGKPIELGSMLSITTWPFSEGDSFCLINSGNRSLLNINDCPIDSKRKALYILNKISKFSNKIDILLTQFGYANWVGNENDSSIRIKAAEEKFKRIFIQQQIIKPSIIIPFASFVYFCHQENFYLNDVQNMPSTLREARQLNAIQGKIGFMKPWDKLSLTEAIDIPSQLAKLSPIAEQHWNDLKTKATPINFKSVEVELVEIKKSFIMYRRKVTFNFLFLPQILELTKKIRPLRVLITDINKIIELSYYNGFRILDQLDVWHISISSEVFNFILKNDFGFNTTHVNGRFRLKSLDEQANVFRFFKFQDDYKNGYGFYHPLASAKKLLRTLYTKLLKDF